MRPQNLFDQSGQSIGLGSKLGSGGEADIFDAAGSPGLVAKVYKPGKCPPAEKLRAIVCLARPELLKFAAWPTATLHSRPNGPPVGILMPRVRDHNEIHTLYGPGHRQQVFPRADWAFLVHTAMNCAAAFDAVHSAGH